MIPVSVKEVVQFVYQSGDLQSELSLGREQLGSELHRLIQQTYGKDDAAEVVVQGTVTVLNERFVLSGRIDGVLANQTVIEEIKSTGLELSELSFEHTPSHAAQAKIYAYLYCLQHAKQSITIHLTYISIQNEQTVTFAQPVSLDELESFFFATMETFATWMIARKEHRDLVVAQSHSVVFPFPRRHAQDRFMGGIYQTYKQQGILYAVAPTGTGKTIGALFSGLKAKDPEDTLFYLTAKNSHKQLAMDSMAALNNQGLEAITVALTAKDHICFLTERDCDPKVCPFAKGYFDKIQEAMTDSLQTTNHFTKEVIEELARAHEVCPFELSLDLSTVADVVVCDYNYVFDPKARLIRYFETNRPVRLLIDEAHNLVSRTKSMYSAVLQASELQPLLETTIPAPLKRSLKAVLSVLDQPSYDSPLLDQETVRVVARAFDSLSDYLLQQGAHPDRKVLLQGMFHLLDFRRILYRMNTAYHVIHDGKNQVLKLACLNAKDYILPLIQELKGTVLFSATLDPLQYYQAYLTGSFGKVLRVDSPFSSSQVLTGLIGHVSVRYAKREQTIPLVSEYIQLLTNSTKNTICFVPSYQYIQLLLPALPKGAIVQTKELSLGERDTIIERFKHEQGILGVFVVGGVFAEGVDYIGSMVEQLLIIGVGMPGVDLETNKTKEYFDQRGLSGFDYAYRYPGISKIIQAAGRLIRSRDDSGIVLLLDERYDDVFYQQMIPEFYGTPIAIKSVEQCRALIDQFWAHKKHV